MKLAVLDLTGFEPNKEPLRGKMEGEANRVAWVSKRNLQVATLTEEAAREQKITFSSSYKRQKMV